MESDKIGRKAEVEWTRLIQPYVMNVKGKLRGPPLESMVADWRGDEEVSCKF